MSTNAVMGKINKMEDYFLIPQSRIESHWQPVDLNYELFCLEYCEEVLEIPLLYIKESFYDRNGLVIELKNMDNTNLLEEDWYIQLRRLSKYARAS